MAATKWVKRFAMGLAILAVVPLAVAAHDRIEGKSCADIERNAQLAANDLPKFLHYQPTDGARYEGAIRRAMGPANIQPK
ncbi:MAG: hypothetical protein JF571_02340 [Asticcacaulis sp.]|nr:hypothetical protein [Asticcacaulis sp.]